MKRRFKWLRFLLPKRCPSRRALRIAIAKSHRETERLKQDLERNPEALRVFRGQRA